MTDVRYVIDPVCGMTISHDEAPFSREHGGTLYYLCSVECRLKFEADADAYAAVHRLAPEGWGLTPHPPSVVEQFRPRQEPG
jgi:Cu+-exporting ATPase